MPATARDSLTGEFVKACNASKTSKYVCLCPDTHAVFLRKGMERVAHFAHFSLEVTCRGGGESDEHMEAKHRLVEMQGRFKFALKTCTECRESQWEDCMGELKNEVRSMDKRWRYDVFLTRPDKTQLALEVYHTHATSEEKVESSALIGVPIAEFNAQDILDLQPDGILHNLQCVQWICGDECVDRKRLREEAARTACEAREGKKRREEAARMAYEAREGKKRRAYAEAFALKIESHRCCKTGKLYYHCEFNGCNNTCYMAPLMDGVRTYGEVYARDGTPLKKAR